MKSLPEFEFSLHTTQMHLDSLFHDFARFRDTSNVYLLRTDANHGHRGLFQKIYALRVKNKL